MNKFFYIIVGIMIVVLLIYIGISIFLNKLNKVIYKKGTIMAFLPIFNVYLLGKLTVNKIVGWLLVIATFITGSFTTSINGKESSFSLLPSSTSAFISAITSVMTIVLFIFAIVKYNKLKGKKFKEEVIEEESVNDIKTDKPELLDSLDEVKEVKKTFIPFLEEEVDTIHPLLQDKKKDEFVIPDAIKTEENSKTEEVSIDELANNCNNMINSLTNDVINNTDILESNDGFDDLFDNQLNKKEDNDVFEQSIPIVEPTIISNEIVENNFVPEQEEIKTIPQEDIIVIDEENKENNILTADDILDIDIPDKDEQIDDVENISVNNNSFEDDMDDFIPDMIS